MLKKGDLFHNRYRLEERLGAGGFSEVWLVRDVQSDTEKALKVFIRQDEEGIALCKREFIKTYRLRHPNIVVPNHFDVMDNQPYLLLPYFAGGNAQNLAGFSSETKALKMLQQIGAALQYIHNKTNPIIHGDVKLDNILLDIDGNFYLTDFGISQDFERKLTQTVRAEAMKNESVGLTPAAFRAPELYEYEDWYSTTVSPKSDIWSFGVCLFFLCTGHLPFGQNGGLKQLFLMKAAGHSLEECLKLERYDLSSDLQKTLLAALALHPEDRHLLISTRSSKLVTPPTVDRDQFLTQYPSKKPLKLLNKKRERRLVVLFTLMIFLALSIGGFGAFYSYNPISSNPELGEARIDEDDLIASSNLGENSLVDEIMTELKEEDKEIETPSISEELTPTAAIPLNDRKETPPKKDKQNIPSSYDNETSFSKIENTKPDSGEDINLIEDIKEVAKPSEQHVEDTENSVQFPNAKMEEKPNKPSSPTKEIEEDLLSLNEDKPTIVSYNDTVKLMLNQDLPADVDYKKGDPLAFKVVENVFSKGGKIIIPKGTSAIGTIKIAKSKKLNVEISKVKLTHNQSIKIYRSSYDIHLAKGSAYFDRKGARFIAFANNNKEIRYD